MPLSRELICNCHCPYNQTVTKFYTRVLALLALPASLLQLSKKDLAFERNFHQKVRYINIYYYLSGVLSA